MQRVLPFAAAVFLQFHLGRAADGADLSAIVAVTTFTAFHPEMFSFRFLGHILRYFNA